jgi:ADP-ribose pyrophosphatase
VSESLSDDIAKVTVLSSERVFEGRVWDVRRDEFEYNGDTVVRDYVDHTGAVAVLALDESDRVLLIKQYRHPLGRRDWEIPAGLLDLDGESPLAAARRELAEEVDLVADRWNTLLDVDTSPGGSTEFVRIYLARGVSESETVFARTEEERDIELRWVDLDEAVDAFLGRQISNGILGVALLAAVRGRETGWRQLGPADEPLRRLPQRGRRV